MTEIYLSEEDEQRLRQDATNKIFLAFLSDYIATSDDPSGALARIRQVALDVADQGAHSDDPDMNQYCRSFVSNVIAKYLDQIKVSGS